MDIWYIEWILNACDITVAERNALFSFSANFISTKRHNAHCMKFTLWTCIWKPSEPVRYKLCALNAVLRYESLASFIFLVQIIFENMIVYIDAAWHSKKRFRNNDVLRRPMHRRWPDGWTLQILVQMLPIICPFSFFAKRELLVPKC